VLEKYTAYTLIDITNSNITSTKSDDINGYNQQQNLNTLIQLIGLRSQPMMYSSTALETQDIAKYEFGSAYSGLHTVWKFEFASEHSQAYTKNDDELYFLKQDCDGAAFTPYLNETVNFMSNTFETYNQEYLNIYFLKYV
jgi:hypothetical protein